MLQKKKNSVTYFWFYDITVKPQIMYFILKSNTVVFLKFFLFLKDFLVTTEVTEIVKCCYLEVNLVLIALVMSRLPVWALNHLLQFIVINNIHGNN